MNDRQSDKKRYVTIIYSMVLAVFLGALGSGVWEFVFYPTARHSGMVVAELAAKYSTQYAEKIIWIASNDPYSIFFAHFLVISAAGLILIIAGLWRGIVKTGQQVWKKQTKCGVEEVSDKSLITDDKGIRGFLKHRPLKQLFVVLVFLSAVLSVIGFWTVSQLIAFSSATLIARDFNVSMQASAPYIGHDASIKLRSRFATMRTWADYQALTKDINTISDKYGVILPRHSPSEK